MNDGFRADSLLPPTATKQLYFLGLSKISDGRAIDWDQAARTLLHRMPLVEVLKRLARLPIAPVPSLIAAGQVLSSAERATVIHDALTDCPWPWMRLHVIGFAVRIGFAAIELDQVLASVFASWEESAPALVAALQWAHRAWQRNDEWPQLSAGLQLACVWSHAHDGLTLLAREALAPVQMTQMLTRMHPVGPRYALPFEIGIECDIACPSQINGEVILMSGLTSALGSKAELFEPHLQAFSNLITRPNGHGRTARAGLFQNRSHGVNAISSYLAAPPAEYLHVIPRHYGALADVFLPTRNATQIQLQRFLAEPEAPALFWQYLLMAGPRWLNAEDIERLSHLVDHVQFPAARATPFDERMLLALMHVLPMLKDEPRASIALKLTAWCQRLRTVHRDARPFGFDDGTPVSKDMTLAFELAIACVRQRTLRPTLDRLAALLPQLVEAWPEFAPMWLSMFARIFGECAASDTTAIVETYQLLRSKR